MQSKQTKGQTMKRIITILLILFFVKVSFAQERLREDSLVVYYRQKALNYQQKVKMAKSHLTGAEASAEATKSARLPQLDFNSRYRYFGVPLLQAPSDEPPNVTGDELNNFYSLNLELYQPILTGGNLKNSRLAALSEVEMNKSLVGMSEQEIMLNSDLLYWRAVAKKEIFAVRKRYKETVGEFQKVINDRVEEEIVGKNELYQAKVRYNDAEYTVITAEKEFRVSLMDLNRMAGLPVNSVPMIADSLRAIQWNNTNADMENKALDQRPEIKYFENQISRQEYIEKVSISRFNPQLGVLAGGKWGSPSPGMNIEPDFNYYLMAQLKIPIFHWNQKNHEALASKQLTEVARLQMEEAIDKVKLEVESSSFQLERSQSQLDFSRTSLNNARMNVEVMMDRYNEGLSSVLEVLDAQFDWQKTYMNYVRAKYELNIAYSRFLYATGQYYQLTGTNDLNN
jgi:outer membrane protein TolC